MTTESTGAESTTADLQARAAIENLVAEYAHGVDTRDADRFAAVWHTDATWHFNGKTLQGTEAFLASAAALWETFPQMSHLFGSVSITVDGDTATGESLAYANLVDGEGTTRMAVARYVDRYTRVDGQWRIAERTTTTSKPVTLG
ncbi:nuclear transport factor 2 family protein [Brevibacterium litoralis]|uniref:nuclear transport factor 2 family protein n=1 Tax=Brevibacterium litoralis TaxID=3138935 RepID=UPI0032ECD05B